MNRYNYFVTDYGPTAVIDSCVLHLASGCATSGSSRAAAQKWLVIAQPQALELTPVAPPESTGPGAAEVFTVNLFTNVERILPWCPERAWRTLCARNRQPASPPPGAAAGTDWLLILTQTHELFLVDIDASAKTLIEKCSVLLDDPRAPRAETSSWTCSSDGTVLLASLYRYSGSLVRIAFDETTRRWTMAKPLLLRFPLMHRLDCVFLPHSPAPSPVSAGNLFATAEPAGGQCAMKRRRSATPAGTGVLDEGVDGVGHSATAESVTSLVGIFEDDSTQDRFLVKTELGNDILFGTAPTSWDGLVGNCDWPTVQMLKSGGCKIVPISTDAALVIGRDLIEVAHVGRRGEPRRKRWENPLMARVYPDLLAPVSVAPLSPSAWLVIDFAGRAILVYLRRRRRQTDSPQRLGDDVDLAEAAGVGVVALADHQSRLPSPAGLVVLMHAEAAELDLAPPGTVLASCYVPASAGEHVLVDVVFGESGIDSARFLFLSRQRHLGPIVGLVPYARDLDRQQLMLACGYDHTGALRMVKPGLSIQDRELGDGKEQCVGAAMAVFAVTIAASLSEEAAIICLSSIASSAFFSVALEAFLRGGPLTVCDHSAFIKSEHTLLFCEIGERPGAAAAAYHSILQVTPTKLSLMDRCSLGQTYSKAFDPGVRCCLAEARGSLLALSLAVDCNLGGVVMHTSINAVTANSVEEIATLPGIDAAALAVHAETKSVIIATWECKIHWYVVDAAGICLKCPAFAINFSNGYGGKPTPSAVAAARLGGLQNGDVGGGALVLLVGLIDGTVVCLQHANEGTGQTKPENCQLDTVFSYVNHVLPDLPDPLHAVTLTVDRGTDVGESLLPLRVIAVRQSAHSLISRFERVSGPGPNELIVAVSAAQAEIISLVGPKNELFTEENGGCAGGRGFQSKAPVNDGLQEKCPPAPAGFASTLSARVEFTALGGSGMRSLKLLPTGNEVIKRHLAVWLIPELDQSESIMCGGNEDSGDDRGESDSGPPSLTLLGSALCGPFKIRRGVCKLSFDAASGPQVQIQHIPLGVSLDAVALHRAANVLVILSGSPGRGDAGKPALLFVEPETGVAAQYDEGWTDGETLTCVACGSVRGGGAEEFVFVGSAGGEDGGGRLRVFSLRKEPLGGSRSGHSAQLSGARAGFFNLSLVELLSLPTDAAVTALAVVGADVLIAAFAATVRAYVGLIDPARASLRLRLESSYVAHCYVQAVVPEPSAPGRFLLLFLTRSVGLYTVEEMGGAAAAGAAGATAAGAAGAAGATAAGVAGATAAGVAGAGEGGAAASSSRPLLPLAATARGGGGAGNNAGSPVSRPHSPGPIRIRELALDYNPIWPTAAAVQGPLSYLMADDQGNLIALAPLAQVLDTPRVVTANFPRGSCGVTRVEIAEELPPAATPELVHAGLFHAGFRVHCLENVRLPAAGATAGLLKPQAVCFGAAEGAAGYIIPIAGEAEFDFLKGLQDAVLATLQPLPLRASFDDFRSFRRHPVCMPARGFVDGNVVETFLTLPLRAQGAVLHAMRTKFLNTPSGGRVASLQRLLAAVEALRAAHV